MDLHALSPGTVVCVPTKAYRVLPVYHVGIVSDRRDVLRDLPQVLHCSPVLEGVAETSLRAFLERATRPQLFLLGYPSELSPEEVIERARSRLGNRYSPLRYNCEHFVLDCHGLPRESPQLARYRRELLKTDPNPWGGPKYA